MSQYRDEQELRTEIREEYDNLKTLGEELKDYQEDLERLQEALQEIESVSGLYEESDTSLSESIEAAIEANDSNIETCQEKVDEVKTSIEYKSENLQILLVKQEKRVVKMQQTKRLLKDRSGVLKNQLDSAIERQTNEVEDCRKKVNTLEEMKKIAETIIAVGLATSMISQKLSELYSLGQSIGLFR